MSNEHPEVYQWLLNWFNQRKPVPGATPTEQMQVNYFTANIIESFDVIELISDVEAHFGIQFQEHHFQDRRFVTIQGLGTIITEIKQE
jgi:acyl carrier protein